VPDPTVATSIQQQLFPTMTCFGCGPGNPRGLQLRSYPRDDATVTATFTPWPEHDNGLGYLNGGIISTVLDCHSAAAVMWLAHQRGWFPADGPPIPYVTAGLEVRYRRPSPLHGGVELLAVVTEASEGQMIATAELVSDDGRTCASATATWKRWRPR
jgi:acyl-coenzyme A thioesterase PaaI-like protein